MIEPWVQERLTSSQAGLDRWAQKARDYGKLRSLGVSLGEEQIRYLESLGDWPSLSEHVRRAVDLYLADLVP